MGTTNKEDKEFLDKKKKEKEIKEKVQKKRDKEKLDKKIIEREDEKAKHEAAVKQFYDYKNNVKKILIKKALMELCTRSIHNINKRERLICENLVESYINDVGTAVLLKNMKFSRSKMLRNLRESIDNYYTIITEGSTASDENTQTISNTNVENFWADIDKSEDIDDITNLIRMRVSNAEEEFINKNQEDKNRIKTVLNQTASRIQNAKETDNEEYADEVEESATRLAKNKIYQIQHEGNRNIFDKMVRKFSKAVLTNDKLKAEYLSESHKLDIGKILESVRCIYTLLETVSTIKLENVDAQYIKETIDSIK